MANAKPINSVDTGNKTIEELAAELETLRKQNTALSDKLGTSNPNVHQIPNKLVDDPPVAGTPNPGYRWKLPNGTLRQDN